MNHVRATLTLGLGSLLLTACGGGASTSPAGSTSASGVVSAPSPSVSVAPASSPSAQTRGPGPAPSTAAESVREEAVFELLEGHRRAQDLPVVATEAGAELDMGLRGRLAPRGSAALVRTAKGEASPGLPIEVVQRIVRRNLGRFRLCYETALRTNPDLEASVTLRFQIDPTGALNGTTVVGTFGDEAFRSCLSRGLEKQRFPLPESGATVTVAMPLTFTPPT